ncbi:MAG: oligosaccharide flippase family protein [Pseudomonadota bacterium]
MLGKIMTAFRDPRSLSERAVNASLWNVIGLAVQYPLRLASNLVLTRLLAPEAFGLMAVIFTLHTGLMLLSDVGIQQSVMREKEGGTPHYLRVAWTAQLARGGGLALLLIGVGFAVYVLGPEIAAPGTVYADPALPWLILASSLMLLIRGASSTKLLLARREMRLKRVVLVDLVGQVVGIIAMIGFSLWLGSVWALLWGTVIGGFAHLFASYALLPGPRMGIVWDRARASAMWKFGRWIIPASLGGFLLRHGDRLLFSAFLDARLFGVYAIAIIWMEIGLTLLLRVGGSVFMPVFSQLIRENRTEALRTHFHRIFLIYSAAAAAILGGYILLIDHVIAFLYEPAYHMAGLFAALAAARLMFLNAQVSNDYIVATGASA